MLTDLNVRDGRVFISVSAFSLAVKRSVNPTRKADDGWKSVKHDGTLLEIKRKYETEGGGRRGRSAAAVAIVPGTL